MQNGRLCDSEGNVRPWEFELAFRDLLRRYAQRRLADCASGAAGNQEAEVAKIGALKMLMLNMEQNTVNTMEQNTVEEARPPPTSEHGVGCSSRQLIGSGRTGSMKSRSIAMLLQGVRDIGSKEGNFCSASHSTRSEEQHTVPRPFTKAAISCASSGFPSTRGLEARSGSVGTEIAAIAHTVSQILWEQRATSTAIEEIRSALLYSGALCDGSTKTRSTQARAACGDPELLCRSRPLPVVHGRRLRMRWRQERCAEKIQKNVPQAKDTGLCDDSSPEQQTGSLQATQTVPSEWCARINYSSDSTDYFNHPGNATHALLSCQSQHLCSSVLVDDLHLHFGCDLQSQLALPQ
jgi:hypothetical protein